MGKAKKGMFFIPESEVARVRAERPGGSDPPDPAALDGDSPGWTSIPAVS
jgi:hypothetical protein